MPRIAPSYAAVRRKLFLLLAVGSVGLFTLPNALFKAVQPAARAATTFTVNSTGDGADNNLGDGLCNDGGGNCTLRAAIQQANATAGADTINLSVNGTINLTGALPNLSTDMTISGPGAALLTVRRDTGGDYRVFTISSGSVHISGLTLTNGKTADGVAGNFGGGGTGGGGVAVNSTSAAVVLTGVAVTGNRTGAGGEGVSFGGAGGTGGGVFNAGTLTMIDCTVNGNSTGRGGNGNNGAGRGGDGGGVFNVNALTISGGSVSGNTTGPAGDTASGIGSTGGRGGGIYSGVGSINLNGLAVSDNTAGGSGNTGPSNAGFGGHGGGIFLDSGAATLTNSTVSGNTTGPSIGTPGYGGGIENSANLTVLRSTISGNTGNAGGAILNRLSLSLINSTVSGNRLIVGGGGGAISNSDSSSNATLTNSTITANDGPGIIGGPFVVRNTIVAGNNNASAGPDVANFGGFNSQGHNLIGKAHADSGFTAPGDQAGTTAAPLDPRLGPLADNGGPTRTHALLADSPALDAGSNALALDRNNNPLTTDQRTFARAADSNDADDTATVDIGAFEAQHPFVEDIADRTTNEDTQLSFVFDVGDDALGVTSVTATSGNGGLVPNDPAHISVGGTGASRTLTINPAADLSGAAEITVTVTGSNGRSVSDTFLLTVAAVNDAPTLGALGDLTVNEDSGPQTVGLSGISAGANEESQTLTVTATSSDPSVIPNPTVSYTSPSQVGSITFAPAANKSGAATITVTVTDNGGTAGGGANTVSRSFNVTVNAVNDAPVNNVPAAQTTAQHTALVFTATNSNAISVADVDAGTNPLSVTLTASNGVVTLNTTAGLTFAAGDGTDDASVSFAGALAAVNAALGRVTFTPAQGFSGAAALQIVTNDQGHTGSGGALSDTDTISINVASGGTIQFNVSALEVNESGQFGVVRVTRTGGGAGTTFATYTTSGGTATGGTSCGPGVDYVNSSGTLSWGNNVTLFREAVVGICDDFEIEGDETVVITLTGVTGSATLGAPAAVTLTIKDVEPAGGVFEFSNAAHDVDEGGTLAVAVKRTGHTSQAARVNYQTEDAGSPSVFIPCTATTGAALDRCDFTKALGTLDFAPGETEKTFNVMVSDDSHVEGPETFRLRLTNPAGGAALGVGSRTEAMATIVDTSPETTGNRIDDDENFVRQHYRDFLNRDPDDGGLRFWKGGIESCGADLQCREVKRIDTSAAFFLSIEFQETGYLAYRTHKAAFGDAVSPNVQGTVPVVRLNDFLLDTQRMGQGVVVGLDGWQARLEANKQAYALAFVQRQRFRTAFPAQMTAEQFVAKLDQNAGAVLSDEERAQLVSSLAPGPSDTELRAAALRHVAEHPTLRRAESNRAFVLMQYFGYLRRNPDDAPDADFRGWKFWLSKLEQFEGDYVRAEMVKAFLSSIEYRQRFGQ